METIVCLEWRDDSGEWRRQQCDGDMLAVFSELAKEIDTSASEWRLATYSLIDAVRISKAG